MDILRYILALGVLYSHTNVFCRLGLPQILNSFYCVGGFFALSGFLMYPSYEKRPRWRPYLCNRARRILPPYILIVLLCAFGLSAVSTLSAVEYFVSSGFWKYLAANLTFLNWLQPDLPGVFDSDAYVLPAVNASLWTMKVEWALYLSLPVVMWIVRHTRLRIEWLTIAVIGCSILYRLFAWKQYEATGYAIYDILSRQVFGMLAFFYCGVAAWFLRDHITRYALPAILAGAGCILVSELNYNLSFFFAPPGVTLVVVGLSLLRRDFTILRHRHNVAYEIYLYHFPIVQLFVYFGLTASPLLALGGVIFFTVLLSAGANQLVRRLFSQR